MDTWVRHNNAVCIYGYLSKAQRCSLCIYGYLSKAQRCSMYIYGYLHS